MSIKNILEFTILFSLLIFISSKQEGSEKFLSPNIFGGAKGIKVFSSDSKVINIKCLYAHDYNFYSLQSLENKDDDYVTTYEGENIYFNFCKNTKRVPNSTFIKEIANDTYVRLTGSIDGEGENKNDWNEEEGGITISFVEGDYCNSTSGSKHSLKLSIKCDPDVDGKDFYKTLNFTNSDECIHMAEMRSLYGCSLRSKYLLLKLLKDYKYVFCVIFVLVGLCLCIKGNAFLKTAIIVTCGFIGCYALSALVLKMFPDFITSESYLFLCLFVCFVLGCIFGYVIRNETTTYSLLLGAGLGYLLNTFVYQIVQNYVDFNPEYLYYICLGVCIVICAYIGYKLAEKIVMIISAILGGYLAMRGVSLVAEHYLDEGLIIDLIKEKEWDQLNEMRDGWTYAYLGSWLALTIVGLYFQCKQGKNSNKSSSNNDYQKAK